MSACYENITDTVTVFSTTN